MSTLTYWDAVNAILTKIEKGTVEKTMEAAMGSTLMEKLEANPPKVDIMAKSIEDATGQQLVPVPGQPGLFRECCETNHLWSIRKIPVSERQPIPERPSIPCSLGSPPAENRRVSIQFEIESVKVPFETKPPSFKVGDWVRVKKPESPVTQAWDGAVLRIIAPRSPYWLTTAGPCFLPSELEPWTPRPGERVRCTVAPRVGYEFTVTSFTPKYGGGVHGYDAGSGHGQGARALNCVVPVCDAKHRPVHIDDVWPNLDALPSPVAREAPKPVEPEPNKPEPRAPPAPTPSSWTPKVGETVFVPGTGREIVAHTHCMVRGDNGWDDVGIVRAVGGPWLARGVISDAEGRKLFPEYYETSEPPKPAPSTPKCTCGAPIYEGLFSRSCGDGLHCGSVTYLRRTEPEPYPRIHRYWMRTNKPSPEAAARGAKSWRGSCPENAPGAEPFFIAQEIVELAVGEGASAVRYTDSITVEAPSYALALEKWRAEYRKWRSEKEKRT